MKTDNISEKLNREFEEVAQSAQEDAKRPRKSMGFPSLDKITTGLVDGDLVVIGSRPAMGKTAFALDIAKHLAKEKTKTTMLFSLEISKEQIVRRLQRASGNEHNIEGTLVICDDPWMTVRQIYDICGALKTSAL